MSPWKKKALISSMVSILIFDAIPLHTLIFTNPDQPEGMGAFAWLILYTPLVFVIFMVASFLWFRKRKSAIFFLISFYFLYLFFTRDLGLGYGFHVLHILFWLMFPVVVFCPIFFMKTHES